MKKINKIMKFAKQPISSTIIVMILVLATLSSVLISMTVFSVPGTITAAVVSSYEWDAEEGRSSYLNNLCRVNDTEYYLFSFQGDTGSDNDGFLRTIHVEDDTGVITAAVQDKYEYDTSDGTYANVVHVPDTDIYVVAYGDAGATKGKVITVQVKEDGQITDPLIDTLSLTYNAAHIFLLGLSDNLYLVAYCQLDGSAYDGYFETVWVNDSGTIDNAVRDIEEFDETFAFFPYVCIVDSDTVAVTYQSLSDTGSFAIQTYNISAAGAITNTCADSWAYETNSDPDKSCITKVGVNVYELTYVDSSNDMLTKTCTISDAGAITESWLDTLTVVAGVEIDYPNTFIVVDSVTNTSGTAGVMGVTCRGIENAERDGYVYTWATDQTGTLAAAIISSYEYDSTMQEDWASVIYVNESYYLVIYEGFENDGWSKTLTIETPIIVPPAPPTPSSILLLLHNDLFTFQGEQGNVTWANSTGPVYETGEFNISYNGTQDIDYIRVNFTNDLHANITNSNISVQFNVLNASWGAEYSTLPDGASTLTLNASNWAGYNWCDGANPFPIATNSSVFWRCRVAIPTGIGNETYVDTNMITWDAGYYS